MKLSQFIKHLQRLYAESGDIEMLNADGKPLSLLTLETAAGKVLEFRRIS